MLAKLTSLKLMGPGMPLGTAENNGVFSRKSELGLGYQLTAK
jgi:hypothetical protein